MDTILAFVFQHVPLVYALVLFFFGAAVGSFLNVVICRLPYGLSLTSPPSSCPKCGRRIFGLDNLPVLSWVILGGKCRQCKEPISWRYPGIEFLNGALWGAVGYLNAANDYGHYTNIAVIMISVVFLSSLVVVTFIDYDHQIIPDEISLGGLALALILSAAVPEIHLVHAGQAWYPSAPWLEGLLRSIVGALTGGLIVFVISMIGTIAFRKQIQKAQETDPEIDSAIGLGDVKLMAFVGAMLGWQEVLASFLLGICIGAVGGIVVKFASGTWPECDADEQSAPGVLEVMAARWQSGESIIPFGPFLVCGAMILFFAREPVLDFFRVYVFHAGALPPGL